MKEIVIKKNPEKLLKLGRTIVKGSTYLTTVIGAAVLTVPIMGKRKITSYMNIIGITGIATAITDKACDLYDEKIMDPIMDNYKDEEDKKVKIIFVDEESTENV